ncbi:bifunctional ADP-dependent NAD(P)H-hydrate dehydratase/NAD(P)H-hydrate epimerase [Zhengella mangrovi]|uniref:Bifunctional NAD(P)H-hydrate repair enzyme n=1 Tax=Zhengella mangrovi TaxID=1982044 RepID=A0A2G1QHV1_9HYPH|nr:NAD(P)H-hydrate dehydratase [Zhengella mangrovi]PHP65034.1 bifunctional ADP-dependent NAD(P)H-hydrate dehydratase/NAD(P)H-hydrate epimerase [Zhengella mangrovi]
MHEILSPAEMGRADAAAIAAGPLDGPGLMENAGRAVHRAILQRFPGVASVAVLCGPGNNGGDGYVIARLLAADGMTVRVHALADPRPGSDAARAASSWTGDVHPLERFDPDGADLVVDALFGAGLSKPLSGESARAAEACSSAKVPVVAVDLPSGLSGDTGQPLGPCFRAVLTVTFFRKKPGHVLMPGRTLCGDLVVADIGIADTILATIGPKTSENLPGLWAACLPRPDAGTHKYARGAAAVLSGGAASTGAARLAAMAAARSGAGAVTVLSPPSAVLVHAAHLTSVMVRSVADADAIGSFLGEGKTRAAVAGPGAGLGPSTRAAVLALLQAPAGTDGRGLNAIVLDADALTVFQDDPPALFSAIRDSGSAVVLTPHAGEFARLFPDLASDAAIAKTERARRASARAGAVVLLKGSDTVIAEPHGRTAVNTNATAVLATAGSGDVLAGIITGLLAQGMPAFEAACAGAWLHGEAGHAAGLRPIAEDLVSALGRLAFPGA